MPPRRLRRSLTRSRQRRRALVVRYSLGRAAHRVLGSVLAGLVLVGSGACGDDEPDRPAASRAPGAARTPDPTASPARADPGATRPGARGGVAWTHARVLARIGGRDIRVEDRTVRLDRATITCGGIGPPAGRRGGEPVWRRFRCVQPTFPPDRVAGPDAIFIVEPTGRRTFAVSGQRFTSY
jgi:hypothetical protein